MKKYLDLFITLVVTTTAAILLSSCGSSDVTLNLSAEDRFELGKKAFDEEKYLEAINHFEVVKLQFPGSAVADDAQLYLAECRFKREEYLLAAEEFQALRRNFPASSFLPQALYSVGLCYYTLSPKSTLDQRYTLRAIDEFQSFIDYYPTHDSVPSAEAKIKELNDRLAQKDFESAELYMKLEYYKAATIYYSNVIEKYHDSPYAERAYVGKVKALLARKRFNDAQKELRKFFERYPTSRYAKDMKSLESEVGEKLNYLPETVGQSSPFVNQRR